MVLRVLTSDERKSRNFSASGRKDAPLAIVVVSPDTRSQTKLAMNMTFNFIYFNKQETQLSNIDSKKHHFEIVIRKLFVYRHLFMTH